MSDTDLGTFVRGLPKAELHVHLEGCVGPERVIDARRYRTPNDAQAAYDVDTLTDFLKVFGEAAATLRGSDDFAATAASYLNDAAANGVLYAEIMVDPQIHMDRGLAFGDIMDGLAEGLEAGERSGRITASIILNFMRERPVEEAHDLLDAVEPWFDKVVAIGIDSEEDGHPPEKFAGVFEEARERGFRLVAHAGFQGPVQDIRQAAEVLKVDRIDHATKLYDDPDLARRMAKRCMPITLCPISEVRLGAAASFEALPLRRMLDDGLTPSIHSDDPAFFGSIAENYLAVARAFDLSRAEIATLARNSFTTSFLDAVAAGRHLDAIDRYIANAV